MDTLLHRFGSIINGTIEGFDRLVFKGTLKSLAHAKGIEMFLRTQSVLNKDFQTWAPYGIQIALNGRRSSLDKEKCKYIVDGNKFLHIEDYDLAQNLLEKQLEINWEQMLSDFSKEVFPNIPELLGNQMSYYWTLWQSEMAKDYIFDS